MHMSYGAIVDSAPNIAPYVTTYLNAPIEDGCYVFYAMVSGVVSGMMLGTPMFKRIFANLNDKWRGLIGGQIAVVAGISAYVILSFMPNFWLFLASCLIIGFGAGMGYFSYQTFFYKNNM